MRVTDLADVLRRGGLKVVEVDGWKARGHDSAQHGSMAAVHGVTCHHDGSGRVKGETYGLNVIIDGRSDLEGPLAQMWLNRSGVFYVVASGLCWHAGESRKTDYDNWHRLGIEAQAAGDGWSEDWPDVQMHAYELGCRVLSEHYGFPISEVLGHKETCAPVGRKVDPDFSMTTFRAAVAVATADTKDWFDMADKDDLKAALAEVLEEKFGIVLSSPHRVALNHLTGGTLKQGDRIPANEVVTYGGLRDQEILAAVRQIIATEGAQSAVLGKILADGGSLTVEQAEAAATAGAKAALAELGDALALKSE